MTPTDSTVPPPTAIVAAVAAPNGDRTSTGASPHAPVLLTTSSDDDTAHLGAQTRAADRSEETAASAAGQAEEDRNPLAAVSLRSSSVIASALAGCR